VSRWRRGIRRTAVTLATLLAVVAIADRLDPPPLERATAPGSSVVLAADGSPLRAFADERGIWRYRISRDQVSPVYLQALIAYEDRWFFHHPGVNPLAIARALGQALATGRVVSGGSTLSMQVARMLEPIPRTPLGKCKQIWRALQIERRLNKDEILGLYLTLAPFGGNLEGVQAASYAYLGKSADRLSDAEAALLVVLPQAPSRLRPDRHPEAAQRARDKVIARMVQQGLWTQERAQAARIEQVAARRLVVPMRAPLLAERLRREQPDAVIQTTIDARIQERVEQRVAALRRRLPERNSVAVMVIEHASMAVQAYVGSADLYDSERAGHVDMVRAPRSPGSTLKPFVYAMALDDGLIHSASLLVDAPQSFDGYQPSNFAERFQGPVSARQALRLSLNVPAVDLLDRTGPARFAASLEHAGLKLRMPDGAEPNLSLILGGAATTLEELLTAYAALARDGMAAQPRFRPTTPLRERRLMSAAAAYIVRTMLERAPADSYSTREFDTASRTQLAWKTGTSYGYRDAWALGVTPTHLVGVWIGRPDGTPQPGQFGAVTALPLLVEVVDGLPAPHRPRLASLPPGVERIEICWPLGIAAKDTPAEHCHRRLDALTRTGSVPPTLPDRRGGEWSSPLLRYWKDPASGRRRNQSCPGPGLVAVTVARWPTLAYPWLTPAQRARSAIPELAPGCLPDGLGEGLRIAGLQDGSVLRQPPNRHGALRARVQALGSDGAVQWLLNERPHARSRAHEAVELVFAADGEHRILAIDSSGRYATLTVRVLGTGPERGPALAEAAARPGESAATPTW
jgi:penicillin-binding protein 1C